MNKNIVIVGASHAAVEAIVSLRKLGWQDKITVIGEEEFLPYQRPPLSKAYFMGQVSEEKLLLRKADYYQNAHVTMMLGCRVTEIDRSEKQVVLDNGEKIDYSKLLLTTGTRARELTVPGVESNEINYLRSLEDVRKIKTRLAGGTQLLIVGAGYIGLEIAASAIKQGLGVTILEADSRVLGRVTSPEVSEFYQQVHLGEGVDIRLSARLESFAGDSDKRYAVLANGEKIPFDCAIVGIGVIPNTELAEQAGLACDNGIVVNEFMQTDDADIYAVGDCTNYPSKLYGRRLRLESVPNAVSQAKTAAQSICGEDIPFNELPWFWSDQYDLKLQTVGLMQGYDKVVVNGSMKDRKFSASYFKNEQLIALDAVNSPVDFMQAKKLLSKTLSEKVG